MNTGVNIKWIVKEKIQEGGHLLGIHLHASVFDKDLFP
jgi:hypothetical protein